MASCQNLLPFMLSILIASLILADADRGAQYCTADIKDFYLNNDLEIFQYMRIHHSYFTDELRQEYNIDALTAPDGYVYCEIRKGMYGLKEAGSIAHENLIKNLAPAGYAPMKYTPGLWKHKSRPTTFTLAVDDFGIKYFCQEDLQHLLRALKDHYQISLDMSGSQYCGLHINWNYPAKYVDISMPNYVAKTLEKYQHPKPKKPQYAPHPWTEPTYGSKIQYALPPSTLPVLDKKGIKRVQSITGTFQYYSRAVDPTMMVAVNELSIEQAAPTQNTLKKCNMLLDYAATNPITTIRYHASDMCLHIDSDAAYLVLPKARSRLAGHYYLSDKITSTKTTPNPKPNGPILTECKTIRNVMSSAAEAESIGIYHNGKTAIPIRTALEELGHPQPPTIIKTDNSTAHGILPSKIRQKRSNAFDMNVYWIKDRIKQKQKIFWERGKNNKADYFTKHFPPKHHKSMRYVYLQPPTNSNVINSLVQGCVNAIFQYSPKT